MGFFKKFNDTKINFKLTLAFFVIAFLSIVVIGYLAYEQGKSSLRKESFNRLTAVREMKATQIEDYFNDIRNQIITFSEDLTIVDAMVDFKKGFDTIVTELQISPVQFQAAENRLRKYYEYNFLPKLNIDAKISEDYKKHWPNDKAAIILQDEYISDNEYPLGRKQLMDYAKDGSFYSKAHLAYHPLIRSYLEKFEYYDIFLVDNETGRIVYSVYKEVDYATSLIDGPYANSNIARAFQASKNAKNKDFVRLVDFESYLPSYAEPASFIATPIFKDGKNIGTLIFQMPIKKINEIMTNRHEWAEVGLGQSGETYIVAEDFSLRNQSRFFIEDRENYFRMIASIGTPEETIKKIKTFESTVGLQKVETEGTIAALEGETNTKIFKDYRGVDVLSSYKPLKIEDMHWVIMSEIDKDEAFSHVYDLRNNIIITFFGLLISIVIASFFISKKITKPIKELTKRAEELATGNLEVKIDPRGGDEIGILSKSFIHMQNSLSDMIHNLEDKVEARTRLLKRQKEMIEEKNKEMVDSINYALRLQKAILPTKARVKDSFPKSFVLYKPKDIISGDFYWMNEFEDKTLIAAVDCTGHGVPGAMVSVVGANGLNRCVKEFELKEPGEILDKLSGLVQETFESGEDKVKDGMDGALISIEQEQSSKSKNQSVAQSSCSVLKYAGAHNPLWIVRKTSEVELSQDAPAIPEERISLMEGVDHNLYEIKADKQPIGNFEDATSFTTNQLNLRAGDTVYLFSDGYADQFGGPRGKKFKYKSMKELILKIQDLSMEEQMLTLDKVFEEWRGNLEQLDDVCVIGIRL
ncbi:MAG: SpoIIE family protein phosphatase [Crocinitomicaceae bacterium]|nr:SpoIIE family protein phosphatase [Crocinitomicaceae bacterium]